METQQIGFGAMNKNTKAEHSSRSEEELQDKDLEDVSGGLLLTHIANEAEVNTMERQVGIPAGVISAKEEVDKEN